MHPSACGYGQLGTQTREAVGTHFLSPGILELPLGVVSTRSGAHVAKHHVDESSQVALTEGSRERNKKDCGSHF